MNLETFLTSQVPFNVRSIDYVILCCIAHINALNGGIGFFFSMKAEKLPLINQ